MNAPSPEAAARRHLSDVIGSQPPTYRHAAFPTREVRAATLSPGDVLAHPVTGTALAVVAVGLPYGYVVAYVRDAASPAPRATDRMHFTRRELVHRAVPSAPDATPGRAGHPGPERTTP